MNTSIIVWISIVGLFIMLLFIRLVLNIIRHAHRIRPGHLISIGTEREEFSLPGDPMTAEEDDYDED